MPRDVLQNINVVGATMVYQEGEQCRWSLDWLYNFCDRVVILLDNYNKETEKIILEYKEKYPDRTYIIYSTIPVSEKVNRIRGQMKKRFKQNQDVIREQVFHELRRIHKIKPIDLLIFPDSDEIFIDSFPKYLETFWYSNFDHMMVGLVDVFDSFQILMRSAMAPHGRVYRFKPEITNIPWKGRTRYLPYYYEKRPWKLRHVVVHLCYLTEGYREKRRFADNGKLHEIINKNVWFLPQDVRTMDREEIARYQPGPHNYPAEMPSITLGEYLENKDYYVKKYNLKLWNS